MAPRQRILISLALSAGVPSGLNTLLSSRLHRGARHCPLSPEDTMLLFCRPRRLSEDSNLVVHGPVANALTTEPSNWLKIIIVCR